MDYIIRKMEPRDIDPALELVHEFHGESLESFGFTCDDEMAGNIIPKVMGTTFVLEVDGRVRGVLAGLITTYMVNKEPVFQEIMWFVSKKYRKYGIKMLQFLEQWCEENNIKQIIMVSLENRTKEVLDKFYKKLGYGVLETQYLKRL